MALHQQHATKLPDQYQYGVAHGRGIVICIVVLALFLAQPKDSEPCCVSVTPMALQQQSNRSVALPSTVFWEACDRICCCVALPRRSCLQCLEEAMCLLVSKLREGTIAVCSGLGPSSHCPASRTSIPAGFWLIAKKAFCFSAQLLLMKPVGHCPHNCLC